MAAERMIVPFLGAVQHHLVGGEAVSRRDLGLSQFGGVQDGQFIAGNKHQCDCTFCYKRRKLDRGHPAGETCRRVCSTQFSWTTLL